MSWNLIGISSTDLPTPVGVCTPERDILIICMLLKMISSVDVFFPINCFHAKICDMHLLVLTVLQISISETPFSTQDLLY